MSGVAAPTLFDAIARRGEEHLVEEPTRVLGAERLGEQVGRHAALVNEPVGVVFVELPFAFKVVARKRRRVLLNFHEQLQGLEEPTQRELILFTGWRFRDAHGADVVVPTWSRGEVGHVVPARCERRE